MKRYVQVNTTVSSKEDADKLSGLILESKLGACVQIIGPITSNYWWKGKVESAKEWLCLIKTEKRYFNALKELIIENHSYEVPEIVCLPILDGSRDYLDWINEVTNA